MGFGMLPNTMTPELSNLLLAINAVGLGIFFAVVASSKIAASSGRLVRLLGLSPLIERLKMWREDRCNE